MYSRPLPCAYHMHSCIFASCNYVAYILHVYKKHIQQRCYLPEFGCIRTSISVQSITDTDLTLKIDLQSKVSYIYPMAYAYTPYDCQGLSGD